MFNQIIVIVKIKQENVGEILWKTTGVIREEFSVDEIKKFSKSAMTTNSDYLKYLINKTIYTGSLNIGTTYVENRYFEEDPQNYSKSFKKIFGSWAST